MLTRYLVAMQDRLGLGDPEFAHKIGLETEIWRALCAGITTYTPAILARLLLHVPNAHAVALQELRWHENVGALRVLDGALGASVEHAVPAPQDAPALAYAA